MSAAAMGRRIALGLSILLACFAAQAQDLCAKTELAAGDKLSLYLLQYGRACTAAKPLAPQAHKLIPAWAEVAAKFAALPRTSPELSAAYQLLAMRAGRAAAIVKSNLLEHRNVGDALWGNVAWKLPEYVRGVGFANPDHLLFPPLPAVPGISDDEAKIDIAQAADADCKEPQSALCRSALASGKALMLAWRLADDASTPLSLQVIGSVGDQVAKKSALWDRYLYQSKPMLPLDHIATDLLDGRWETSDQYPDGVREPPKTQYFLLHPSVAVEHLNAATDGQQFKPVLVLEVLGANRWREDQRWLDVPVLRSLSGAALAVSYADRAGVQDTGAGVLLTFNNAYQFGVMRYDGKTGLLFSIDLANLWRDKYKDGYQSFRTGLKNARF